MFPNLCFAVQGVFWITSMTFAELFILNYYLIFSLTCPLWSVLTYCRLPAGECACHSLVWKIAVQCKVHQFFLNMFLSILCRESSWVGISRIYAESARCGGFFNLGASPCTPWLLIGRGVPSLAARCLHLMARRGKLILNMLRFSPSKTSGMSSKQQGPSVSQWWGGVHRG